MKFIVNSKHLKSALGKLSSAYEPRAIVPMALFSKVDVFEKYILLTLTNFQVSITQKVECDTTGEGSFLVPYKEFKSVIELTNGVVSVEWTAKKGVSVKTGTDTFNLGKSDDVKEFPPIPQVDRDGFITVGKDFFQAVSMASKSVVKDSVANYIASHVCVELSKTEISITGTDIHCLFTQTILNDAEIDIEGIRELLIPNSALPAFSGIEYAFIYYNDKNMLLVSDGTEICISLGEGKYLPYRTILPNHKSNLSVDANELIHAVEKSFAINGINVFAIVFQPSESTLKISVEDDLMGMDFTSSIECKSSVTFDKIGFNRSQLLRAVKQLSEVPGMDLEISMPSASKAVSFRKKDIDYVTVLVFPLSLKDITVT